jgi:hypothetical protein
MLLEEEDQEMHWQTGHDEFDHLPLWKAESKRKWKRKRAHWRNVWCG